LLFAAENLVASIDDLAQIQGFKYVFVAGVRIPITFTYRFFGSFVPRKTVSGRSIVPYRPDVPLAERPCGVEYASKDEKNFHYVYFVKSTSPNIANTEDSNQVRDVRFLLAQQGTFTDELLNINKADEVRSGR